MGLFPSNLNELFATAISDAVKAVELANPALSIPMHYNTFPEIIADPNDFKRKVEKLGKQCRVLEFGEEITL